MKIKRLEICGFKSFVDRTVLHFDHDVTGVVGPNGCGKSNIVDAIRWAMGEQSAKTLRGRGMEDVIFNGSEDRGPHGFAEVSITFANSDGLAPPEYAEYAEIQVTRRLDRQGNSDYSINKTPVRLMDVVNLFLGTGVGKRAYSIIEQGRIGYIVSSKPEDRRLLLEEAAGVTKFKLRKKAAERKMDQTRQNLLRVGDIVQEIERSLATLKRQAQKAERYKKYRDEVRDLELHVAAHRWLELTGAHTVVRSELEEHSAGMEGVRYALRVREAELEAHRVDAQRVEAEVERAQSRAYELDNQAKLLESQISHRTELAQNLRDAENQMLTERRELSAQRELLEAERGELSASLHALEDREREANETLLRETEELERRTRGTAESESVVLEARGKLADAGTRIARAEAVLQGFEERRRDALARVEKLGQQRAALIERARELDAEAEAIGARLEGLASGKDRTAQHREQVEQELEALRVEIRQSDVTLESLRERLSDRRSRLRSLEEIHARFEGIGAGAKALVADPSNRPEGVVGILADLIEAPTEWTKALAGALGERLEHVVVSDDAAALRALAFLREGGRGRATVAVRREHGHTQEAAPTGEGVHGWLADKVRVEAPDEGVMREALRGVLVVDSLETAAKLAANGSGSLTFVTVDGDVVRADGTMTGGSSDDGGAHLLELKREVRELHQLVGTLESELTVQVERHQELRKGIASRQATIEAARAEAHDAELAILAAEKDWKRAQEEAQATRGRELALAEEATALGEAVSRAAEEEREAQGQIELARADRDAAQTQVESAEAIFAERRQARDEQSHRVTEVKIGTAQARERAEGDRGAMQRLVRSIDELGLRDQRLVQNLADGEKQRTDIDAQQGSARTQLESTAREAMDAHQVLSAAREAYEGERRVLASHEEDLKLLRSQIDSSSQHVNALTVREREMYLELAHLLENVTERHRIDLRRVLGDFHLREIPGEAERARIQELSQLIERMGEINLTAIEEFEEKNQRYTYLTTQRDDLEEALRQLDRAIRQMNRESRRLFHEAFHAINERFKVIFPKMFGGGKAELRLTDAENILESGIDIIAQPPGKKLGSLELMSGGEKALTAVSLIFSIFQYKPSPFCLLDEVDAPLDEANIGRFSDAVRQMTDRSQFIIITHAKRTMETADVLYGVTMETPGVSKLVSVELTGESRRRGQDARDQSAAVA